MKSILVTVLLLCISCIAIAQQSTCKSRCEEELGVGDSRCNFCKDVREDGSKRPRKKPALEVNTAPASAPASAPAISIVPPQATKKEGAPASSTSVSSVKKNN